MFVWVFSFFHLLQSEYETPHGRIDLSSCMTVKSAEQKTSKRNALEVSTHDTTYFMYANTEKARRRCFGGCTYPFVCVSVCLFLSVCHVSLWVDLIVCLYDYLCLCVCLSVCLSIFLSVWWSACLALSVLRRDPAAYVRIDACIHRIVKLPRKANSPTL